MNCVNHSDREQVAFCQHCGRPICAECLRRSGAAVFCTGCWTPRATAPTGNAYPGYPNVPPYSPVEAAGEPNPVLAALLGFIPGVGAMYNGQYPKGIAHLIVFVGLVALADQNDFFGFFVAGWIFYMAIEAYHTASARRDGRPLPDPFGLNQIPDWFGVGKPEQGFGPRSTPEAATGPNGPVATEPSAGNSSPFSSSVPPSSVPPFFNNSTVNPMSHPSAPFVSYYRRFPTGAVWLILLGAFFLLNNTGFFHFFHTRFFMPILLIGFGVWTFVHKMIDSGLSLENDGSTFYRWRFLRAVSGSFWIVLVGVIWLLDTLQILTWSHSWPLFLIAAGVLHLIKHSLIGEFGGYPFAGYGNTPYVGPQGFGGQAGAAPVTPPTEVGTQLVPSDHSSQAGPHDGSHDGSHDEQEGR